MSPCSSNGSKETSCAWPVGTRTEPTTLSPTAASNRITPATTAAGLFTSDISPPACRTRHAIKLSKIVNEGLLFGCGNHRAISRHGAYDHAPVAPGRRPGRCLEVVALLARALEDRLPLPVRQR